MSCIFSKWHCSHNNAFAMNQLHHVWVPKYTLLLLPLASLSGYCHDAIVSRYIQQCTVSCPLPFVLSQSIYLLLQMVSAPWWSPCLCNWLTTRPRSWMAQPEHISLSSVSLVHTKAVFTLGPVLFRILANRTRRVDLASGLHSHYKRLTRCERFASTSPCTHCVSFATGCDPITCSYLMTYVTFPGHVNWIIGNK